MSQPKFDYSHEIMNQIADRGEFRSCREVDDASSRPRHKTESCVAYMDATLVVRYATRILYVKVEAWSYVAWILQR